MDTPNKNASSTLKKAYRKYPSTTKCRVCLQPGTIPIFGKNKNITQELIEIAAIVIMEFDDLPKHICENCYELLQSAILIRRTARRTDLELRLKREVSEDHKYKDEKESVCSEFTESMSGEPFVKCEYLEVKTQDEEESDTESDGKTGTSQCNDYNTSIDQDEEHQVEYLDVEDTDEELTENEINLKTLEDSNDDKMGNECNVTFHSAEELQVHKNDKHNTMKCDICNETVSKTIYKVHLKTHRSEYLKKVKKYKKVVCEICHKSVYKSYYKYHKKLVHGDDAEKAELFKECPYCNKKISVRNIMDHIKRVHDKPKDQTTNLVSPKTQCPVCDKNIKEEIYKEHLANHGRKPKVYMCEACGKEYATASALKTHTLTHGNELKYKCNFCPYRGLHLGLLKIHVRTHTKDYNYKCSLCPAKFITKSNLSIHLQRHTGIGKYKCEVCDKRFYLKRNRLNHYKAIHCVERNFKCDMCDKTFPHRDAMLSHQIKKHNRSKLTPQVGRIPTYLKNESSNSEETVF